MKPEPVLGGSPPISSWRKLDQAQTMNRQVSVSDTFTLSGDNLDRLRQALDVVAHQANRARKAGYGARVDDVLTDIEELARDLPVRLGNALDDDMAEAEELGDADRNRRAWYPFHRAA
jgi:hypothetical protein